MHHSTCRWDADQFRQSLQRSWTSSLELCADGPQTAGFVIQSFQTVAEEIFLWSVGPKRSANLPLNWALENLLLTYLQAGCSVDPPVISLPPIRFVAVFCHVPVTVNLYHTDSGCWSAALPLIYLSMGRLHGLGSYLRGGSRGLAARSGCVCGRLAGRAPCERQAPGNVCPDVSRMSFISDLCRR